MLINFYSDSIVNDNGFLAEYMAIRECYILVLSVIQYVSVLSIQRMH